MPISKNRESVLLLVAFAAAFLAVGIPFWLVPYSEVELPGTMVTPALLVIVVLALALRAWGLASFRKSVLFTGLAAPAAVIARVAVETFADPTSHNLWPFEVVFSAALGLACAALGAILGAAASRLGGRPGISDPPPGPWKDP